MSSLRTAAAALAVLVAATLTLTATAAGAPARTEAKPKKNLVQTAVAAGSFKTLVSLVKQAGLAGTLTKGHFTVFAPTDAAFEKVPKKTLQALAKDKAKLQRVLLYHVAKGRLTAKKVVARKKIKTVNGRTVNVRVTRKGVKINLANVKATDIAASNGVIHVVDKVLIP